MEPVCPICLKPFRGEARVLTTLIEENGDSFPGEAFHAACFQEVMTQQGEEHASAFDEIERRHVSAAEKQADALADLAVSIGKLVEIAGE